MPQRRPRKDHVSAAARGLRIAVRWAVLVAALVVAPLLPALAQDYALYDRVRIADDPASGRADPQLALFSSSETGEALLRTGDGRVAALARPDVAGYELLDVLSVLPTIHARIGVVPAERATLIELFLVRPGEPAGVELIGFHRIEGFLGGSAFLEGLQVFLADADRPVIGEFQLCHMGLFDRFGPSTCQSQMRRPFERRFELPLGPLRGFVVDPQAQFVVSLHPLDGVLAVSDTGSGKVFDTLAYPFLRAEPGPASIRSAAIRIGPREYRMSVLAGFPGEGVVDLIDIDADFRQPRPAGRVSLDDLRAVPPPFVVGFPGDGPGPEGLPRDIFARVATSDEQSVILVGGHDNVVHALARDAARNSPFRRLFDLRSEGMPIVDFDVSADGGHIVLLRPDGPKFIETAPLLSDDVAAREAYLETLAIRPVVSDAGRGNEIDLGAAIQTRLAEEGFYRGIADGFLGPETRAALARFAERSGRPALAGDVPERPTALDPDLLAALFWNRMDLFPRGILAPEVEARVVSLAFADFFETHLPDIQHFKPDEVYTLGRAETCRALNVLPPPELWPGILRPVRALDELRGRIGSRILIESAFETGAYGDCAGTAPSAPDLRAALGGFRGLKFTAPDVRRNAVMARLSELAGQGRLDWGDDEAAPAVFYLAAPEVPRDLPDRIGRWHVQVAAYDNDTRGCGEAIADVSELAGLLAGSPVSGGFIYTARQRGTDGFRAPVLVTIDFAGAEDRAREAVRFVRAVAGKTGDGRTGADAYIREGTDLGFDPGCLSGMRIP